MDAEKLAILLASQPKQKSELAKPTEVHQHIHLHQAPALPPVELSSPPDPERLHPLVVAMSMLLFSVALALPLTLLAAIVDAINQPDIYYLER